MPGPTRGGPRPPTRYGDEDLGIHAERAGGTPRDRSDVMLPRGSPGSLSGQRLCVAQPCGAGVGAGGAWCCSSSCPGGGGGAGGLTNDGSVGGPDGAGSDDAPVVGAVVGSSLASWVAGAASWALLVTVCAWASLVAACSRSAARRGFALRIVPGSSVCGGVEAVVAAGAACSGELAGVVAVRFCAAAAPAATRPTASTVPAIPAAALCLTGSPSCRLQYEETPGAALILCRVRRPCRGDGRVPARPGSVARPGPAGSGRTVPPAVSRRAARS